jgi:hypothetical protein
MAARLLSALNWSASRQRQRGQRKVARRLGVQPRPHPHPRREARDSALKFVAPLGGDDRRATSFRRPSSTAFGRRRPSLARPGDEASQCWPGTFGNCFANLGIAIWRLPSCSAGVAGCAIANACETANLRAGRLARALQEVGGNACAYGMCPGFAPLAHRPGDETKCCRNSGMIGRSAPSF